MQYDPKTALWVNLVYMTLSGVTAATLQAAGFANATQVAAIASILALPLNAWLHAYSSPVAGPLAPQPQAPAPTPAASSVVNKIGPLALAILAGSLLLFGAPRAEAATAKKLSFPAPTGNLVTDLKSISQFMTQKLAADFSNAQNLATAVPGIQDPVGQACWGGFSNLGTLAKLHPLPLTLQGATDLEALRLWILGAKQICALPQCTQVWADFSNDASAVAPPGFSVPSLQQLCSHLP